MSSKDTVRTHDISVLPGDGIGLEVVPAAMEIVDRAAASHGFRMNWREQSWGSDYFRAHGRMMPVDALDVMAESDAIFLGAVGDPDIPDAETLWGMLIPIRRSFDQYVNLRPIRTLPGVRSPLVDSAGVDVVVVVRENVEGEYSAVGGRSHVGLPAEAAYQQSIFTRSGVERVARFAADLAQKRRGRLVSATKSNGIIHTMPFWDEVVESVVAGYDGVQLESVLIDALAAGIVLKPQRFDVIVASNLFGDILSDIAAATVGSIGVAPSANLNPEGRFPSLFEPVHGTAPDIAGRGIANPIGQIWTAVMMLEHLGEQTCADGTMSALVRVLESGISTGDLGGTANTRQFTDAILAALE